MWNYEELIAEQFFNRYLSQESFPLDLRHIALAVEKELSLEIFFEECLMPIEISAQLRKGNHAALIYVNQKHSLARRRFAVAHEFGHLLLGHRNGIPSPGLGESDTEFESANHFASVLLMPEPCVSARTMLLGDPAERLTDAAKYFGVSLDVAARRLTSLDCTPVLYALLDSSRYQILWEHCSPSFRFDREEFQYVIKKYFISPKKSKHVFPLSGNNITVESCTEDHYLISYSPLEKSPLCAKEEQASYAVLSYESAR